MRGALNKFVAANRRLCRLVDQLVPREFSVDGNRHFATEVVPRYVRYGMRVVDAGGGKTPFFLAGAKQQLALFVVGLDESGDELSRAPNGSYDEVMAADICDSALRFDADFAVCMTVIEHVSSAECAMATLFRMVKPGGKVAVFVPCRNTIFARLNLLLPEHLKQRILHGLYPESAHFAGFPAHYDQCTPTALDRVARRAGFLVVETRVYYWSGYFDFFVPFYVAWRAFSLLAVALFGNDAGDRFFLVLARGNESA